MARIETFNGPAWIADESIWRIQCPSPTFPYTRIFAGSLATIETQEPAQDIVDRLVLQAPLAVLTRPDGTPVWLNAKLVTYIGSPLNNDQPDPPNFVRARLMISGSLQLVQEDPQTAANILALAGAAIA